MRGRLPVKHVERVVLGSLSPGQRSRLTDQMHGLWSDYFVGLSREDFCRTHLFDDTRLVMSFGPAGDLAGFANINSYRLRAGGREHLVLASGLFNRLEYRSSAAVVSATALEVSRIVARNPGLPVSGVAIATNPVAYDLAIRMVPRCYPHPDLEAPPEVAPLLQELAARRNLRVDPADPWTVHFPVRTADPDRLRRSGRFSRGGRGISWYEQRLPDWTEGRALCLWAPIDLRNIGGVFWNAARNLRGPVRP